MEHQMYIRVPEIGFLHAAVKRAIPKLIHLMNDSAGFIFLYVNSFCYFVYSFLEGSVVDHRDITLQAVKQRYAEDRFYNVSQIEVSTQSE